MLEILLWLLKLGRYLSIERCIYLETTNCRICMYRLFASHGKHKQNYYSETKIILKAYRGIKLIYIIIRKYVIHLFI